MLYQLLYSLSEQVSGFNLFRYLSFRTIYAAVTAMALWFLLGGRFIRRIRSYQISQFIREEGPDSHQRKAGTPTMGGVLILGAAFMSALLWADLKAPLVWLLLLVGLSFGAIGFHDDFLKIKRRHNQGLSARRKFLAQTVLGLLVGLFLYFHVGYEFQKNMEIQHIVPFWNITVPFFKEIKINLGIFYIPFAALVIVGASNAVNLTDGLDGLASGPMAVAAGSYGVFIYLAGNAKVANYLQIIYVPGAGECTVVLGALVGACLGFLWFNTYPAQIFMGDVGSLSLGALLGAAALICKQELLLIVVGGIFVVETLSVIMQVGFFKATGGRRIFKMAPLHHHFELKGWPEPKVIVRFWIIAGILSLVALSTLKIR